ncbi:exopolysaccharide Pel transporter PelG [Sulfurihydrogenibium yellowstonense]|uniref:Inner membrane protein n=1 Tax=Sulfurihydrogenibium yellowstonense SS-5 TaxID=432331 RepID=C4FJN4_9AQUI|nr:exopolysaccharide Pel transporter PelG [Sulfurihydrogenibium yellowstonense]EEP60709.1 inner membrane protein [Sulfurihydrogenibium yellowstonense SS-5]
MAGISFELRKVLRERTLGSIVKAFGYSAVLSAGPYLISILTLALSFYVLRQFVSSDKIVIQFGVIVTYLTAFSLILTGFSQLMITRFLADRIFEKKYEVVLPNLIGNILLNMILAFIISLIFSVIFFKEQGAVFIILYVLIFTIMCGLWIINVVLTGFKSYKFIVFSFATAYITFFLLALYMARYDLAGLMFSFFVGQTVLFFLLLGYFIKTHYSDKIISFDFFDRHKIYISLIFSGFFYNLGIWIDKFIFWFYPDTSIQILGPIRASIVYDIPMFLAYIAIAPGMAVFFLKLETEFADYYDRYYRAVREGATLNKIYQFGDDMILSARSVIFDTLRIQGIAFLFFLIFDTLLFKIFKLSLLYIPLFHVLMVGTYLQLIFMTLLAILNYFDRRREVLYLSILFAVSNAVFTYASILLGPYFYGYGYAISLFISDLLAIILLRRFLDEIHYQTFMLI